MAKPRSNIFQTAGKYPLPNDHILSKVAKRRSSICKTAVKYLSNGQTFVTCWSDTGQRRSDGGRRAAGSTGRSGAAGLRRMRHNRPCFGQIAVNSSVQSVRSTLRSNPCGRFFGPIRAVDSSVQSVWGLGPNPAGRPAPPPVLVKIRRILCVCGARVKGRERENRRTDRH